MPRQARLDIPGHLYHIIARGLDRRPIFYDEEDRVDFLSRVEKAIEQAPTQIYAWALMPNHFHFLARAGEKGLAPFMRRLMSGYANYFNRRHNRQGYLFQNRFKSVLCEEGPYFLELVRYIHLNPIRAGLVKTLMELKDHPWTGHPALVGLKGPPWQNTKEVLALFSADPHIAVTQYDVFLQDRTGVRRRINLMGGGLRRSVGKKFNPKTNTQEFDSQILGSGDFVKRVLSQVANIDKDRLKWRGTDLQSVAEIVANKFGIKRDSIFMKGRKRGVSQAKSVLIYAGVTKFGETQKKMSDMVCISPGGIGNSLARGEALWNKMGFEEDPLVKGKDLPSPHGKQVSESPMISNPEAFTHASESIARVTTTPATTEPPTQQQQGTL